MTWTVDYGQGPRPVTLPHAWHRDVPVTWEGPATYRTEIQVTQPDTWLVFDAVSYEAIIRVNGETRTTHRGMWDAFAVRLGGPGTYRVEVQVTKNGGPTFPVKDVLSGFLPYVYQTWGGIYGDVRLVSQAEDPTRPAPAKPTRVKVQGRHIQVDGKPFYMRGMLTWGWYPELAHPNPPLETCRREAKLAREMGFNTVKFCLWIPIGEAWWQALEEEGLYAWVELPLWAPSSKPELQAGKEAELRRIVQQLAHRDRIICWTVGCETGPATPPEFRERMVDFVRQTTGCPLVKDISGSAEMYGGDPREFGTYDSFHPYCDTTFYLPVLQSLMHGPREDRPILMGEFNDYDIARDLGQLREAAPYWASDDPNLNAQGSRWQYDFPAILKGPMARHDARTYAKWIRFAISKGHFMRRRVHEYTRMQADIAGYVVTGWRHTPISTSGMIDDTYQRVYEDQHTGMWNQADLLALVPDRFPPWVNGGNRPGFRDTQVQFSGQIKWNIGAASESGRRGQFRWRIEGGPSGDGGVIDLPANEPRVVDTIDVTLDAGRYLLTCELGEVSASWPIHVFDRLPRDLPGWRLAGRTDVWGSWRPRGGPEDTATLFVGTAPEVEAFVQASEGPFVAFVTEGGTAAPFWRECFFDYADPGVLPFANRWEWLFSVGTDQFLAAESSLGARQPWLMTRIDTRTYAQHAVIVRVASAKGWGLVTTLRPWGGQGGQPSQFSINPGGHQLVRVLMGLVDRPQE